MSIDNVPNEIVDEIVKLHGTSNLSEAASLTSKHLEEFPNSPHLWNIQGVLLHQSKQLSLAAAAFSKVLELAPAESEAWYNLGQIWLEQGKFQKAIGCFENVIRFNQKNSNAHFGLGLANQQLANFSLAEFHYNKALEVNTNFTECYINLGEVFRTQKRFGEAVRCLGIATQIEPSNLLAKFNFGLSLKSAGDFQKAISELTDVVASAERIGDQYILAEAHFVLGKCFSSMGDKTAAYQSYRSAIENRPDFVNAINNLGVLLLEDRRYEKALHQFELGLKHKENSVELNHNLATAFYGLKDFKNAVTFYKAALEKDPRHFPSYLNLANSLVELGSEKKSIEYYKAALAFDPSSEPCLIGLADAYVAIGNLDAAAKCLSENNQAVSQSEKILSYSYYSDRRICRWKCGDDQITVLANPLPFMLLMLEDDAHHQLLRSQSYSKKLEQLDVLEIEEFVSPVRSGGKLRLGYFSSDFRDHPVLHLLMGMLREHDRSSFELYGYSSGRVGECAMREEAKGYFDVFTDINEMSDADVIKLARGHQLDVVVNLDGYTGRPRNEIFAHRVAPVQINYLGYPSTMGADFMDYIVADKVIIPEDYQQYYSEKVLYLPDVYLPNDDKREVANTNTSRSDFGLPEDGFVFCCFNSSYKISPAEFDVWMRILGQVEGSVLWLSSSNKWAVENLKKEAEKRGISADRIIFASRLEKNSEHLARHKHADLFIDTFNYNAHTTAGDALMTGLPLVTKQGEQFAARVASSLLHALDLEELVTRSVEEYEALILELATKPEKLKAIKAKLAKSLTSRPAFNTKTYTQNFEQIIKNAG